MIGIKLLCYLSFVTVALAQDTPVKVSVYYESLCPDSKAFISEQLGPTYDLLSDILLVDFVPFGKENFTANGDSWDFVCQHGPEECYGNKIQACALNYYPDNSQTVPFIVCAMSAPDAVNASQGCAEDGGLDWQEIYDCANSDLGSSLLHDNGLTTGALNPPLTYVPWIILNDVYSDINEVIAQVDFIRLVCETYTGTPPDNCADYEKKVI